MSTAAVCYLPGRWANGQRWALDDPSRDITQWLRAAGWPVATVRYRTARLQDDLDALARVSVDDLLADAVDTIDVLRDRWKDAPVFLVGYSLGAALACLLAAEPSIGVAGLVLLDGGLHADTAEEDLPRGVLVRSASSHPRFRRLARARGGPGVGWGLPRDDDQCRFLLEAHDAWWPTRVLHQLAESARDPRFAERWGSGTAPVLGVTAPSSGLSGERCRRTVAARRYATTDLVTLPADWNHGDVMSHPQVAAVWSRVDSWLRGVLAEHEQDDVGGGA